MKNLLENIIIRLALFFRPKWGSKADIWVANLFKKKMKRLNQEFFDSVDLDTKDITFK